MPRDPHAVGDRRIGRDAVVVRRVSSRREVRTRPAAAGVLAGVPASRATRIVGAAIEVDAVPPVDAATHAQWLLVLDESV